MKFFKILQLWVVFLCFGPGGGVDVEDSYWELDEDSPDRPVSVFNLPGLNRFPARASTSQSKGTIDLSMSNDTSSLNTAPPTENGEPIKVDLSVLIIQVRDIREINEELTLELNLRMYWKDPRLNYLVHEDGQGKKFVAVSLKLLDKLWYPDIYLDHVKSISQPSIITRPASLRVYSDSTVRYSARFTIAMSCPMDFHMYPADTQKCGVDIKSYAFTSKILDLKWAQRGAFLVDKLELPNFDVGLDRPENFSIATTSGSYAGVRFKVVLRRKLSYHLLQTYFPSCLFVTISWLSFLVQPESVPARMTLSMTTLLTLTSMFSSIRQGIPSVSYIKALDVWMVWCVLFVWATLVEYAVVLKLNSMKRIPRPLHPPPRPVAATPSPIPPPNHYTANILRSSIESAPEDSSGPEPPAHAIYNPKSSTETAAAQAYEVLNLSSKCLQFRHRFFRSNSTSPAPPLLANGYTTAPATPAPAAVQMDSTSYKPLVLTIEQYTSLIIPTLFLLFNIVYWPWLLRALDASEDETEYYHL